MKNRREFFKKFGIVAAAAVIPFKTTTPKPKLVPKDRKISMDGGLELLDDSGNWVQIAVQDLGGGENSIVLIRRDRD